MGLHCLSKIQYTVYSGVLLYFKSCIYRAKRKEWSGKQVVIGKESGVYSNFSAINICSLYHWYENEIIVILHGSLFICKGLQSIKCRRAEFMNLNDLIQKASIQFSRFIFGHFKRSDGIFLQNLCSLKLNWM